MTMIVSRVFLPAARGRMVAVVQGDAGEGSRPGDRLCVLPGGCTTRVTR